MRAPQLSLFAGLIALAAAACGTSHGTTGSGGAGGTGGATTTSTTTTSTTTTSTGPCVEAWSCSPWETDGVSDAGTRACTDLNQCGTTAEKPLESATLPALDFAYFQCNVEPIFDRKCSMLGCHGTEQGRALRVYARGRKRLSGEVLSNPACGAGSTPAENCDGSNACLCAAKHTAAEWRRNFDAARGLTLDSLGKPILPTKADKCDLLAQPVVGGKDHAGVHLFVKDDAEYAIIKNWVTGAMLGQACEPGNN